MDAGRFDSISRSLAKRKSRRAALQGLGAAGLVAALGAEHARAATGDCSLHIFAKTSVGPNKDKTYSGTLNLSIADNGSIDAGTFSLDDGTNLSVVGQVTGRAINLRIKLPNNGVLALTGTADIDLLLCRGDASGVFGGPSDADVGTWRTGDGGSAGGSSGTTSTGSSTSSSSGTNSSSGSSSGSGNSSGSNNSGSCASGVVCNGVCCTPAPGLSADNIMCNAGACECTYSCASAGCSGGDGFILNTCGSDPTPHCHSECNTPSDNGCGDMACNGNETLDVDSCTCMPANDCGADLMHDANNCGFCGVVCGSGFCQNGVCTDSDPCVQTGMTNCNSMCADLQNDPENCGNCGNHCPSGQCIEGNCTEVIK